MQMLEIGWKKWKPTEIMGNNKSYVVTVFRLENIYYVNKKQKMQVMMWYHLKNKEIVHNKQNLSI